MVLWLGISWHCSKSIGSGLIYCSKSIHLNPWNNSSCVEDGLWKHCDGFENWYWRSSRGWAYANYLKQETYFSLGSTLFRLRIIVVINLRRWREPIWLQKFWILVEFCTVNLHLGPGKQSSLVKAQLWKHSKGFDHLYWKSFPRLKMGFPGTLMMLNISFGSHSEAELISMVP